MNLQQASKYLAVSKKRLWRAVKSGQLTASRVQRGARWEYRVTEEELQSYRRKYLDSLEMKAVAWSVPERDDSPLSQDVEPDERDYEQDWNVPARDETSQLHTAVVAQLAQARMRIVDLESRLKEAERQRHLTWQRMADLSRREEELTIAAGLLRQAATVLSK